MSDNPQDKPTDAPGPRKENLYRKYGPLPHTPSVGKSEIKTWKEAWEIKTDDDPPPERDRAPVASVLPWDESPFYDIAYGRIPGDPRIYKDDERPGKKVSPKKTPKNSPNKDQETK
ncbi:hypothetical protein TWF225_007140 [Orbilia oligospora]|nr:hypothetical protein TWF751_009641 [Orbilia oligospora]KAF3180775.1 hypothetical protein TWF225_007140 [Orbilia oligospora]KAF3238826.1 hypothetical protein TWF217_001655 [Orbilia oligospora]KAF3245992.1 hypothetical protein TWF128_009330 [Orbilia oligospora]KAF3287267.1 hypothetical protein TWF132_008634 [Orbilia oligospora]